MIGRDLRQRDIVPPDRLTAVHATVIGVGSIGRQVAIQLAALGVPKLHLVDHDTVEIVNLSVQGWRAGDIGLAKVHAAADVAHQSNPAIEITTESSRFRRSMTVGNAVFCCVDSITTRRLVWESVHDRVTFFADGRMSAEVVRVLAAADERSREHYPTTLFGAERAHRGACTGRSTIYAASIAAGLILAQFTRFLRGLPVDADLQLNLLAGELTVTTA